MAGHLDDLARRVQVDPFFLASALAIYARSEGIDDAVLAAHLGCPPETLTMLRLCRRPHPDERFAREITTIAERFPVGAEALAMVVRRADALDAMRETDAGERGTLIAARDREPNRGAHPPDPEPHEPATEWAAEREDAP